ncbi:hypothetical protein [Bullifex porci]|uniref:hypothetical protein n=1 Tax=Bullifex porci TaxID=2606638 RepID=UPI0023F0F68C|nr:hypothetical protein [Bullifex porci]MDD7589467.1 hypothetical protein [Bullifex porci]
MSLITFDNTGDKKFEAGVDHCVLYPLTNGAYNHGVAWNGITGITESPEGGDAQDFYADNIKYGSLRGAENFGGTIECYTYPDEWKGCDGRADLADGVTFSQQSRKIFGLSYRTLIGSDTMELGAGYILHIIYGCTASPSSKSRSTVNESPEAGTMSYEFKTTPVNVSKIANAKATSHIEIDSTKVSSKVLAAIEAALYGKNGVVSYSPASPSGSENPASEGWYERSGSEGSYVYTLTTDNSVQSSKTYYIKNEVGGANAYLPTPDQLYDLIASAQS